MNGKTMGLTVVAAPDNGIELTAVRLRHPDREEAALLWTALGAEVSYEQPGLIARWPDSSLTLQIEPGEPAGPLFFVFSNATSLPAHPRIGPAVQWRPLETEGAIGRKPWIPLLSRESGSSSLGNIPERAGCSPP